MSESARLPVVCGVDVGSTNVKVVALDPAGRIVGRVARPTPRDAEQLSIDTRVLFQVIEDMVAQVCGDVYVARAVSSAGVGEDGVLLDASLQPLTRALAWFDPRRQAIFQELMLDMPDDESFDAEDDATRTFVGWTWARRQTSAIDARHWVAVADLAGVLWSREPFMSDTLASRTGAWRSSNRQWAPERVQMTLGPDRLLPHVVRSGSVVGELHSPALARTGVVNSDTLVVAGGHDHPIGGWAADQLSPGAVLDSMGTAEVIVAHTPQGGINRARHIEVAPGIRTSGTILLRVEDLSRNISWASRDADVAKALRALMDARLPPANVLDSGYFFPGTRGGLTPSFAADAPRDPIARASAVLGALAHVGKDAVEAVLAGLGRASEVRLAGGWARSNGWLNIKTRVNDYPTFPIREPEVTAVGAALLAATALGWSPDPHESLGTSSQL